MENTLVTQAIKDAIHSASSIQEALKIADSFKVNLLNRPIKPYLAKNASSQQAKEYAHLLEIYEKEIADYKVNDKEIAKFNYSLYDEVEEFVKEHTGFNAIVPDKYKAKVWSYAYAQGHSSGISEIANYLIDLIGIFEIENSSQQHNTIADNLLAVEFGYKQCEKGNNIQMAISEYKKLI